MKKTFNIVNILRIRVHDNLNEYVAGHIPTIEYLGEKVFGQR